MTAVLWCKWRLSGTKVKFALEGLLKKVALFCALCKIGESVVRIDGELRMFIDKQHPSLVQLHFAS